MALIVAVNLLLGSDGVEECSSRQFLTLVKKRCCVRKQMPEMFCRLAKSPYLCIVNQREKLLAKG